MSKTCPIYKSKVFEIACAITKQFTYWSGEAEGGKRQTIKKKVL